jgi:hypothetical protein
MATSRLNFSAGTLLALVRALAFKVLVIRVHDVVGKGRVVDKAIGLLVYMSKNELLHVIHGVESSVGQEDDSELMVKLRLGHLVELFVRNVVVV